MTDQTTPPGEWVLLEIFGHRQHWGYLTEVERFGSKLARIDEFRPGEDAPRTTHYYGGGSIFSITPVTEETARKRIAYERLAPAVQSLLPPADMDTYDDDDDEQLVQHIAYRACPCGCGLDADAWKDEGSGEIMFFVCPTTGNEIKASKPE